MRLDGALTAVESAIFSARKDSTIPSCARGVKKPVMVPEPRPKTVNASAQGGQLHLDNQLLQKRSRRLGRKHHHRVLPGSPH